MFEWLIKEIFRACINAASYFVNLIISTFGFDLKYFTNTIPIVSESYSIFQTMAVGFVMLFLIWQCFKALGAPIGIESDDPIKVFFKSILAVFCIYNAQGIFNIGFETLKPVYEQVMNLQTAGQVGFGEFNAGTVVSGVIVSVMEIFLSFGMTEIIVYGTILLIIMFQLVKMLLEITERYILMGILAVTSPLGFSTMTSKATERIFTAWSRMVMSQFVIYLLNIWILKMFLSGFASMQKLTAGDGKGIVWLIFMWSFLKVAQKMDQFLSKLGIEVGNVGGSLMEELIAAKAGMSLFGGKGDTVGGGGILGALKDSKSGGGLASALKTAAGGGAAVISGGILASATVGIANKAAKSFAKSPVGGLLSYHKSIGAAAFKDGKSASEAYRIMKGKSNSSISGIIANNAAGAGAWVSNGIKQATGMNALTGRRLANRMNQKASGDSGLGEKALDRLNNSTIAANALNNLHEAKDDSAAKQMLKGIMAGQDLGDLMYNNLDNVQCKAYNGGISWSYEVSHPTPNGGNGVTKYEGVVAINGNNDATRHVLHMRNTTPGISANTIKRNGIEITYASKKTVYT